MSFADVSAMVQMVAPSEPTVQVERRGASVEYRCNDRVATAYAATTGAFGLCVNESVGLARWRWHGGLFCGATWRETDVDTAARAWCVDGVMPRRLERER